jgi:PST family polysaccharide transporter
MKREFSAAAAWSGAASWLEQATGVLVFVIIARIIGVEEFGIVAMAFAFLFLGEFLVRDTITETIVERGTLEEGRLEATFFALVGFSATIVLVLLVVAQVVAPIYEQPLVAPLLSVASPTVLLVGMSGVSTALLRRRMHYKALAIRTIVGVMAGGVVGVTMALNGFGAWSLVGQRVVEIGLNSVLAILGARWWPRRLPTLGELRLVHGLGTSVLELRLWTLVTLQTPAVALGIVADARAAGLFAVSARLMEIVLKLSVNIIRGVAQSAIAALRRQTGSTAKFFLDLTELSAFAGFLSFAGLALIAEPLARVALGQEWDAASSIIPFICLAGAAITLTGMQEAYLMATDRLERYLAAVRLEACLGVVLVGAASFGGAVAVGAAVALRALLFLPIRTRTALLPESISTGQFASTLVAPAIVAAIMAVGLAFWRLFVFGRINETIYLAVTVAFGVAIAIVAVAFMPATLERLKSYVNA